MSLTRREKRKAAKRKDRERRIKRTHNLLKSGAIKRPEGWYRLG